jgi:hypothetical protein
MAGTIVVGAKETLNDLRARCSGKRSRLPGTQYVPCFFCSLKVGGMENEATKQGQNPAHPRSARGRFHRRAS